MNTTKPTGSGLPSAVVPSLDQVREAQKLLYDSILHTPLFPYPADPSILLKLENLQVGGSFKLRGVLNWARHIPPELLCNGLYTFSAGNTALALGIVAQLMGVSARSYIPDTTPQYKREALTQAGVETIPRPMPELMESMFSAHEAADGWNVLHPWHDPHMLAGSATLGLELLQDCPDVESVFIPIGGGGLAGGVGGILKQIQPKIRIIGVEPENSSALYASLNTGNPVWIESQPTICDGVAVPLMTDEMFPLLSNLISKDILCSEDEVRSAIRKLVQTNHVVAEGAGALALAAALKTPREQRGLSVVLISGGNIGVDRLATILS